MNITFDNILDIIQLVTSIVLLVTIIWDIRSRRSDNGKR